MPEVGVRSYLSPQSSVLIPHSSAPSPQIAHLPRTLRKYARLAHHWRIRAIMRFFAPILAQTIPILAQLSPRRDGARRSAFGVRIQHSESSIHHSPLLDPRPSIPDSRSSAPPLPPPPPPPPHPAPPPPPP